MYIDHTHYCQYTNQSHYIATPTIVNIPTTPTTLTTPTIVNIPTNPTTLTTPTILTNHYIDHSHYTDHAHYIDHTHYYLYFIRTIAYPP